MTPEKIATVPGAAGSPANAAGDSVVVTGAAGFIGARLAARLTAEGEKVVAVDERAYFENRPEIAAIYRGAAPDIILATNELPDWLDDSPRVSGIIHLGACTDTTEYDEGLLKRMNTDYSRRLWEAAAGLGAPFLFASSAAVYGDGSKGYDDRTPPKALTALNPYGESKRLFDIWALNEGSKTPPPAWAGFRFFNVYGFGEAHKKKMSSVLYQAFVQILEQGEVRLFRSHKEGIADGHQRRDFIHVEDVVDTLALAWRAGLPDGIYNLGTGRARTFLDLANAVFAAMDWEPRIKFIDTPPQIRPRYQYFTEAKMDKLTENGGGASFTPLEEGAERYWKRLKKVMLTQGA